MPIPDNVTFPLLPLGAEAAHALPVQERSLLRQRPHHAVSGCDLGQWVRTVDLYGPGAGAIHAETCQGEAHEAPEDAPSGFDGSLSVCCSLVFLFCYILSQ